MLQARNRKMMIWWHEEGYTDQMAARLPKDITIFDWHYGNQASYPSLENLQSEGFSQTWATPAVMRYYSARNDWDESFGNISGFMRAGAQRQVPGECTCTWVHGIWGGRNLFELNLYGLVYSASCAWNPLAADAADFRWRFGREWFGLDAPDLEQQVTQAIHAPYGDGKEQKFWTGNAVEEEMLAVPLSATAQALRDRPALASEAAELLAFCDRADGILAQWSAAATRNRVTVKYLGMDVHIHATLARRILAVAAIQQAWPALQAAAPAQREALLKPHLDALRSLVADYRRIESDFTSSILEAGGGNCGTGPWYPYIAKGGVIFRAPQGREAVETDIARLAALMPQPALPADPLAP